MHSKIRLEDDSGENHKVIVHSGKRLNFGNANTDIRWKVPIYCG